MAVVLPDARAQDPLRPSIPRGVQHRALVVLQELPTLSAEAGALRDALWALESASDRLWEELLSQRGDADHAFRWTADNKAAVTAAKDRFRDAKADYLARGQDLAAIALQVPQLEAVARTCLAARGDCEESWDLFTCAPFLPVCLAEGL